MDAPGFVSRITENPDATAIVAHDGTWSFGELTEAAGRVAAALLRDKADLDEGRVAFLLPPGCRYSAVLLGTWAAGGVAVPLATSHPAPELEFVVEDVDASVIVASDEYGARLGPIAAERGIEMIDADRIVSGSDVGELGMQRRPQPAVFTVLRWTTDHLAQLPAAFAEVEAVVRGEKDRGVAAQTAAKHTKATQTASTVMENQPAGRAPSMTLSRYGRSLPVVRTGPGMVCAQRFGRFSG